jgi:molybdate transport system substrate-binding protein
MDIYRKRVNQVKTLFFAVVLFFPATILSGPSARAESLTVFAAASTTDVVSAVVLLFNEKASANAVTSFAASSTLAKQIENGAPADIFISADQKWMDYLAKRKCIDPATRFDLLANTIVIIAPVDSTLEAFEPVPGFDLKGLLNKERLAMGDPDHVPAGRYGKEMLVKLDLWSDVEPLVVRAATVRAALALVERNEVPLGIVYATDAAVSRKVKIIGRIPVACQPSISYPVAIVTGRKTPAAERFMEFLKSEQASEVFAKAGFTVLFGQ